MLTNLGLNLVASGAGAAVGGAIGGSNGAINGAGISSDIEQYNGAGDKLAEKLFLNAIKLAQKAARASGSKTAIKYADKLDGQIDDVEQALEHKVDQPIESVSDSILNAEFKVADEVKQGYEDIKDFITGENPKAPTSSGQNQVDIPQKANDILNYAEEKGSPLPGYKGSGKYRNQPNPGDQLLPTHDTDGNPITYQEWDVDPLPPKGSGKTRNAERVVTGSDGSAYYTNDHYHTFNKMRDFIPKVNKK